MTGGERWGSDHFDGFSTLDLGRWSAAVVVVAAGGWGAAFALQSLPAPAAVPGAAEPAILIDLAPMPEPEAEPVAEVEPAPQPPAVEPPPPEVAEPQPEPPPPEVAPPEPEELPDVVQPEPDPEPEPVPEPQPEPQPEPAEPEIAPPPEPEELAETVAAVPMPVTMSQRIREQREKPLAPPKSAPQQPRPTASTPAPRQPQSAPASPPPAAANTVSPQQWQAQALARLDRRKVYPRSAQAQGIVGAVVISFTVGSSGQIGAVSVVQSSGAAVLDQAALDTARRASPLPPPPPGYADRAMSATIRFVP